MGMNGIHLLVLLTVVLIVLVAVALGLYLLIRKAVAAGVRDGRRTRPQDERPR